MYVEHPYKFNDKFYAKVDGKFYEITREVAKAMLSAYRNEVRCYTVKDLQEMLDVSRSTVYKLLRQNEFRWIQLEGGWLPHFQERVLTSGWIREMLL